MRTLISITVFMIFVLSCTGQEQLEPQHYFITAKDGLSSNIVYEVMKDSKGYLWFGTDAGIEKYNGSTFKHFTTKDGLINGSTFELIEDKQGRIWTANFGNSLCYIQDDKVHHLPSHLDFRDSLRNQLITSITTNKDTVWFMTRSNPVSPKSTQVGLLKDSVIYKPEQSKTGAFVNSHVADEVEWGTYGHHFGGFYRINVNGVPHNIDFLQFSPKSTHFRVISDKNKGAYMLIASAILHFDQHGALLDYFYEPQLDLLCLYMDSKGDLFAGSRNDGVFIFNAGNLSRQPIQYFQKLSITAIEQDINGGYWLSTLEKGCLVVPSFQSYTINQGTDLLKRPTYLSANAGLIGFSNGDLYKLNTKDPASLKFITSTGKYIQAILTTEQDTIMSLMPDSFIMSSSGKQLTKISGKYLFQLAGENRIAIDHKYYFIFDNDSVYYSSYDSAVNNSSYTSATNINILSSTQLKNGEIMVSTLTGLYYLEGTDLKKIANSDGNYQTLTSLNNKALFNSDNNEIFQLDWNNQSIKSIFRPKNTIENITGLLATDSMLIASTGKELFYVDTVNDLYHPIGVSSEGIADLRYVNHKVWYRDEYGVSQLDLCYKRDSAILKVMDVLVDSIHYSSRTNSISLPHGRHYLSISYEALNFDQHYHPNVVYKIGDNGWISSSSSPIQIPLLSYGEYKISIGIKERNNRIVQQKEITLTVAQPFYLNWWFILSVLLTTFLGSWLVIRKRFQLRLDKKEELRRRFELRNQVLRSQINPHFIFNSLGSLQDLILNKKNDDAVSYLLKFSNLFRSILNGSRDSINTLNEELSTIRSYLDLEKIRFSDSFEYEIVVNDDINIYEVMIPSLLLQPFVENAIIHGISNVNHKGLIKIMITKKDNQLLIEISDNGIGRNEAAKHKKNVDSNRKSLGLDICRERINLFNEGSIKSPIRIIDFFDDNTTTGTTVQLFLKIHTDD